MIAPAEDPVPGSDLVVLLVDDPQDAETLAAAAPGTVVRTFDADDLVEVAEAMHVLAIVPGDPGARLLARARAAIARAMPVAHEVRLVEWVSWAPGTPFRPPGAAARVVLTWATMLPDLPVLAVARGSEVQDTKPPERESHAEILLRLAGPVELFHASDGRTYATVPVGDHRENFEIRSTGFRRWLTRAFYESKRRPPSAEALQQALGVLEAQAAFDGPTVPTFVRVAPGSDGSIYLDLGGPDWSAVEIRLDGWRIVDAPSVRFRRPNGLLELPTPRRGGSLELLRNRVNVETTDFPLLVGWVTAAFRPAGPYPVLALSGEQGSAKSTLARLLRGGIDPHASPLRAEPREPRDLMIGAINGWVVAYDNISSIAPWLSDALCRLSTGGGFAARTLYTDAEETFLDAQRPVIVNGIEEYARRGDLIDRCIFLNLPRLSESERQTEAGYWSAVRDDLPLILGALLDAVVIGLRLLPSIRLARLPRMADFAAWGEAVWRGLGHSENEFLDAYTANRQLANESALEDSAVAQVVRTLVEDGKPWTGTHGALLETLSGLVPEKVTRSNRWPRSPRGLSGALRRIAPGLRMVGINVEFGRGKVRTVTIRPETDGIESSAPTPPTPNGNRGHPQASVPTVATVDSRPFGVARSDSVGADGRDGRFPRASGGPPAEREVIEL